MKCSLFNICDIINEISQGVAEKIFKKEFRERKIGKASICTVTKDENKARRQQRCPDHKEARETRKASA